MKKIILSFLVFFIQHLNCQNVDSSISKFKIFDEEITISNKKIDSTINSNLAEIKDFLENPKNKELIDKTLKEAKDMFSGFMNLFIDDKNQVKRIATKFNSKVDSIIPEIRESLDLKRADSTVK